MHTRVLAAAGIRDPDLIASYRRCQELNAEYGKTYYLATLLLPAPKRPFVHALYGFARYADEIVDNLASTMTPAEKSDELRRWGGELFSDLQRGASNDPVRRAVVDTALRWEIPPEHFEAFLHSMAMDLTVDHYDTYEDLYEYVYGSAAVIGLQVLPILEPAHPDAAARAEALGVAFQLANFIRDVDEDLDRGRIYLPLAELEQFGVSPDDVRQRRLTPAIRSALQHQIARVRRLDRYSRPGIAMLHPAARDCIDTARVLYCGIVDAVEDIGYDVFSSRATVPLRRRLAVAGGAAARASVARRVYGIGHIPA
jgi:phytoene synthase